MAGKWLLLASLVALLAGSASALFLFALEWATQTRVANRWLLALLPLAGFAVGWVYLKVGQQVEAGNNLLIDEIHDPKNTIPLSGHTTPKQKAKSRAVKSAGDSPRHS